MLLFKIIKLKYLFMVKYNKNYKDLIIFRLK